ncbi:MAG: hypothetical protein ACLFUU_11685 [Desulfobacteraceae bacterium]
MKIMKLWVSMLGLMILAVGCSGDLMTAANSQAEAAGEDAMVITGTVRHIPLEGGFYGIIADNGERYDPINLDPQYAVDGLRVRITARVRPDQVSFHMWGKIIEIITIEKLSAGES